MTIGALPMLAPGCRQVILARAASEAVTQQDWDRIKVRQQGVTHRLARKMHANRPVLL